MQEKYCNNICDRAAGYHIIVDFTVAQMAVLDGIYESEYIGQGAENRFICFPRIIKYINDVYTTLFYINAHGIYIYTRRLYYYHYLYMYNKYLLLY